MQTSTNPEQAMMKDLDKAEAQLEKDTAALRKAVRQASEDEKEALEGSSGPGDEESDKDQTKKLKKALGTNRGIETMFRSVYRVQLALTGLADNKANMMISINGIIISIIIASVAPKLDSNPWLLVPTSVFLLGTLVSIIFAILAARPRVISTVIDMEDLHHSKGNILFFSNFTQLKESEFVEGMTSLIQDKTVLYESMIRDIYGLGSVLQKKFALLQVAYTSFMIALILGVSSFMAVFVWILQQTQ
jgi:hypothetical protein